MGRGVRRPRAGARRAVRPRARLVIGRRAQAEFTADIRYIRRESFAGARTVLGAVNTALQLLKTHPERGPIDADAGAVPERVSARRISTKKYVIRYLFPVRDRRGGEVVLILSIRHGARLPISDEEFLLRYAEERAGVTGR